MKCNANGIKSQKYIYLWASLKREKKLRNFWPTVHIKQFIFSFPQQMEAIIGYSVTLLE